MASWPIFQPPLFLSYRNEQPPINFLPRGRWLWIPSEEKILLIVSITDSHYLYWYFDAVTINGIKRLFKRFLATCWLKTIKTFRRHEFWIMNSKFNQKHTHNNFFLSGTTINVYLYKRLEIFYVDWWLSF